MQASILVNIYLHRCMGEEQNNGKFMPM